MKFRIHFEHQDGTEDSFDVSGETLEEMLEQANAGLQARNGKDPWSERLEDVPFRA